MAITQVAWIQAETYRALDVRLADAAVFGGASTTTMARPGGVFPGFGGELKVTSAGLTISVASGACLIPETSGAGSYRVVNDATVTASAGGGSGVSRIDLVIMRVYDTITAANSYGIVEIIPGGASPPPMPAGANAIKLAEVTVTNSVTTVADFRTWAVAVGGITPVTSATRPASPYDGQAVWENDTFNLAVFSGKGGAWRTVPTGSPSAWTTYTPAWTAHDGNPNANPTLGSSKIYGRYQKNGTTVHLNITLNINTALPFGVGNGIYAFSLPVTGSPPTTIAGVTAAAGTDVRQLLTAHFFDASGDGSTESSKQWMGNALIRNGGTTVSELRFTCGNSATLSKGGIWRGGPPPTDAPFAVATGDQITVSGTYECAP